MEKGDNFLYRKKEYAVKLVEDGSLHRFYEAENGKLKKII